MIQFGQVLGVEVIFAVLLAHCLPTGVAMNVYNEYVWGPNLKSTQSNYTGWQKNRLHTITTSPVSLQEIQDIWRLLLRGGAGGVDQRLYPTSSPGSYWSSL